MNINRIGKYEEKRKKFLTLKKNKKPNFFKISILIINTVFFFMVFIKKYPNLLNINHI